MLLNTLGAFPGNVKKYLPLVPLKLYLTLLAVSHMTEFEKTFRKLGDLASSANTSCKEFTGVLEALGFNIENCGNAGHKIAKHPAITLTEYPDYNCGHNQGEAVKRPYIKKLHKFVKQHEDAIKEYLK